MKKRISAIVMTVVLVAALAVPVVVLAVNHDATQDATTSTVETLNVIDKTGTTTIATITFPEAAVSTTVDAPFNDVDTFTTPQVLSGSISEPVVRIENTTGLPYIVWLSITDWQNGVVVAEDYELAVGGAVDIATVTTALSTDGLAATVSTFTTLTTATIMDLYLTVDLGSLAGKTGTSTLSVLGETP